MSSSSESLEAERQSPDSNDNATVLIIVRDADEAEELFVVHKHVLLQHPGLVAAFLSSIADSPTKAIELSLPIRTFRAFRQWLYTGNIMSSKNHAATTMTDKPQGFLVDDEWVEHLSERELLHLWILGEYVEIPAVQNAAMYTLSFVTTLAIRDTNEVFARTNSDSLLRRFCISKTSGHSWADIVNTPESPTDPNVLNTEAFNILLQQMIEWRERAYLNLVEPDIEEEGFFIDEKSEAEHIPDVHETAGTKPDITKN